jgi:DnaK suppressor protein
MVAQHPDSAKYKMLLAEMREQLLAARAVNDGAANIVELDQTRVGRLSRMDAMQSQAMSQAANQRRDSSLLAIDRALERIDIGTYGECIDCLEQINPNRLEADPVVRRCISCAEESEKS